LAGIVVVADDDDSERALQKMGPLYIDKCVASARDFSSTPGKETYCHAADIVRHFDS